MRAKQSVRNKRRRHAEAADWFLRNSGGGQSAEDVSDFQAWLDRDPDNQAAYAAAEQLMGDAHRAIRDDPKLRDLEIKPRTGRAKPIVASLLMVGMAAGLFVLQDGPMRLQADAMSDASEMPILTLADGSTLHLNASSAVSYDFGPTHRTVKLLRGQAFFQVAPDAARPFVVEARGGRTTALGTAFDVRLGEDETDVTVTEHAVAVSAIASAQSSVRVREGQQASYGRDGKIKNIRDADALVALAWQRGQLVVDNAALSEVVTEIGRHFSGRIVIASQAVADRRVSGTFTISNTEAALAFLERTLGITVTRVGPLILIRG